MLLHHTGLKLKKTMKIDVKSHQDTYLKNPLRNITTHFDSLQGTSRAVHALLLRT